jgi:hypothetical protein
MITENPKLNFIEVCECWRRYEYADGHAITINNVVAVDVTSSHGGHRLVDQDRIGHYIQPGWLHLCWQTSIDVPVFSF